MISELKEFMDVGIVFGGTGCFFSEFRYRLLSLS